MKKLLLILSLLASAATAQVIWEGGQIIESSKFSPKEYEGGILKVASTVAATVTTNILWWEFASAVDPVEDSAGNVNEGGHNGTPTHVTNSASISAHYTLATTDFFRETNLNENPSNYPITLVAWMKSDATSDGNMAVYTHDNGASGATNQMSIKLRGSSGLARAGVSVHADVGHAESATVINDDSWYHVVGVFETNSQKVYINGVLDGTNNLTPSYPTSPDRFIVGRQQNGSSKYDGEIDEVQMFNIALSAAQVLENFDNGKTNFGFLATNEDTNNPTLTWLLEYDGIASDATGNGWHSDSVDGAVFAVYTNGSETTGVYDFDGVSDRILIDNINSSNIFYGQGSFTVAIWVNPRASNLVTLVNYGGGPVGDDTSLFQFANLAGVCNWRIFDTDNDRIGRDATGLAVPENEWTHWAATWDGTTADASGLKIYMNGLRVDNADDNSGTFGTIKNGAQMNIAIGVSQVDNWDLDGQADDFRFYQDELTGAAITNLYDATKGRYQ